jgi:hypothetical protein
LKQVRADVEGYIKALGFEPVLHERGQVPYEKDAALDDSCYREIEECDILVSLIGGRYGSAASHGRNSITQEELKTALDKGKQVHIFVESGVHAEYRTYEINQDNKGVKWKYAEDPKVYEFIAGCYALRKNAIYSFESAQDIVTILREQWAGLFQRFLQKAAESNAKIAVEQRKALQDIEATAKTLKELVTFLTKGKEHGDVAINEILMSNHPIFLRLKNLLRVQYRVYFTTRDELTAWLGVRGFKRVDPKNWDSDKEEEWIEEKAKDGKQSVLKIDTYLFMADGRLRSVPQNDWHEDWVTILEHDDLFGPPPPDATVSDFGEPPPDYLPPADAKPSSDDDIPF